ncbi:MAG: META domain-containing protein [Specibacter sp.]
MKRRLVLSATSLLLLSACTTPGGATPETGTASPGIPLETPVQCTPAGGGVPRTIKDFECLNLGSVSGSDATGELAWLGSDPFTVVTMVTDGALSFSSKTPCNILRSQVTVTNTQFVVGPDIFLTQMGCPSPQTDHEKWVVKFFSSPLDYTLNADSLVLRNNAGTVAFKPA